MELQATNLTAAAVRKRKIRRKKIISLIVAIVVLAAAVLIIAPRLKKTDPLAGMITAKSQIYTITQKISATGTVTAQTGAQVNIASQIGGRIKRLYADVGGNIKAGEVIAELDLPDLQAQLDQAKAGLQAAQLKYQIETSGVGLERTTTSSGITSATANLASAQTAYDQAVKNASLTINAAVAAVNQAKASERNAQTILGRDKQLLAKGYIANQDVDTAQTAADVAAAQLDSAQQNLNLARIKTNDDITTARNTLKSAHAAMATATAGMAQDTIKSQTVLELEAEVNQAKDQVAYAQAQYDKTLIRSPITGTVTQLPIQQGETVAAGLSTTTLITVVDLHRLQVDAMVDETDIGSVALGQDAAVTVDAYPNTTFTGHVSKIASGPTTQQNVVTYDTTIALDDPGGLLKPGMTATAVIMITDHADIVAVPIEAVKTQKKNTVLYVLNGKSVQVRKVTTGVSDETMTEIVKGLKAGETVVLAGYTPNARSGPNFSPFGRVPGGGGGRGR